MDLQRRRIENENSVKVSKMCIQADLGHPRMVYGLVVPQPRSLSLGNNGSANNHGYGGPEKVPNSIVFTTRLGKAYPCAHIRTCTIF
jgi:hypothetical protein